MDRRRAGALLALAACIATTAAAPTASNQTALDLYDGASEGCYYNFQHYGEGDRIMTNEPCLNCTCHNRMLMCYLRVCPFTKPIGQDCSVEKRADQCCPIVTCPDVPVDLLTSTSTSSPAEYGETGLGKLDRYGCSINGKYFPEGSKVPPTPNKPCEHCYCIRNMTTCVMQECTLHVDGCTPIYRKDVCCPVRYSCDHPEDEIPLLDDMTTTVRPTPGFLLTTTTLSPVTQMTQDCVHDDKIFPDGALIKTEKACEHCYCMKGDIVCVVQECGTPMENEGKNCTSMPPREGQCCPDTYICEGDEFTTEPKPDFTTVITLEDITTLSPPRRVSVEGSGYRSETDEPFTEAPTFEPDTEGSGEEQQLYKPTDESDILIPDDETSSPSVTTGKDEMVDQYTPRPTKVPVMETEMADKVTTEPDKGENTVPSGLIEDDSLSTSGLETTPESKTTSTKLEAVTEPFVEVETTVQPKEESSFKETTPHEGLTATEATPIAQTTITDHDITSSDGKDSTESESFETTGPTRRKEDDEETLVEITTPNHLEEFTTKESALTGPNTLTTESTMSSIDQEVQTSTSLVPEKDNEVLIQEPTTDLNLELTTKSDVVKAETQSVTTIKPDIGAEVTTSGKIDLVETTSANPIENEIDEESFPTSVPVRIPGEGDCLLDGVTYRHESVVPSSNNCHVSCMCISSIVKCEPIICSPPPDYMDNCQPMYDTPESCCPTYVCDHPRETVPPQSHSQMAGTESPVPTPTIECDGDQCEVVKDKEHAKPAEPCTSEDCTDDSRKKPDECGPHGCSEAENEPKEPHPSKPEGCIGDSCSSTSEQCSNGNCEPAIPTDQTCNHENGCEIPVVQACEGENCSVHPDETVIKDGSTTCANADDCNTKDKIPEKSPHCAGESCISELPPQTIPKEEQDCKDNSDCRQPDQTPVKECNEEGCQKQKVPDIHEPGPTDCSGTECSQQEPQITNAPEINTESMPSITELPESPETKYEEPVTELPKTTAVEKEIEPSRATEASILEKEEELKTTPGFDELDKNKEKEHQPSESPEIVTKMPGVQQEETTLDPLHHITKIEEILPEVSTELSELPITEAPIIFDIDTKDNKQTDVPESVTSLTQEEPITNQPEDAVKDKDAHDITTAVPSLLDGDNSSPETSHETTESQEMLTLAPESLDSEAPEEPTKTPEYVQDTDSKVTDTTEVYTTAPEQISTDKFEKQPIEEQESQGSPTTPKSFNSQNTNAPETLDTKTPAESELDSSTFVPETQTTLQQEDVKKEPELSDHKTKLDEHVTNKQDDTIGTTVSMDTMDVEEETQTKKPILYDNEKENSLSDDGTQAPQLITVSVKESSTISPVHDTAGESESQTELSESHETSSTESAPQESDVMTTEDKHVETPAPVTVHVQTETPMSIVKDRDDNEINITKIPDSEITTEHDELITKQPELTEPDQPLSMESEKPSEKPISDSENISTVRAEEPAAATTEKPVSGSETTISPVLEDKLPTETPIHDSEITAIPETKTSTDNTPVSVSISAEYPELYVTETGSQGPSIPEEKPTESAFITLSEDVDTKTPDKVTESSAQPTSESGNIITPAQEHISETTDSTELPELTVHEHPTEQASIAQEPEQLVTEEVATNVPDTMLPEQQDIPEKDTSEPLTPQDDVTKIAEETTSQPQKDMTGVPQKELVTTSPEHSQTETSVLKDDVATPHIPEITATESETEASATPEPLITQTHAPEIMVTEKEGVETPETQDALTTIPKISENEPQEAVTGSVESQSPVTETTVSDVFVTEPHKNITEVPEPHEMVTSPSIPFTMEPQKESTGATETPENEVRKEITDTPETQDITTIIPEIYATEPQQLETGVPDFPDTATKISEIVPDELPEKVTEEPVSQDKVTSVPNISETESQKVATKVPEQEDLVTILPEIPETVPKEDTSEATMTQNITTSILEETVTESAPVDGTHAPVNQDISTTIPELSEGELQRETTEGLKHDDTTNIPAVDVTEPQKEVTEVPVVDDALTTVPDLSITQSEMPKPLAPESQDTATSSPETAETEPKKETTESPESQEDGFTNPEISQTEPKKEITEKPETLITDAPSVSATESYEPSTIKPDAQDADSKVPETITTEYQKEVTIVPEVLDMVTKVPQISTELQKETSEPQEIPEKSITESQKPITESPEYQNTVKDHPEIPATESQHELTESPVSPAIVTNVPEVSDTESDKVPPVQESVTKMPELTQAGDENEPEENAVTEKDDMVTEPPLKLTTKLDDGVQSTQQIFVASTESSEIEADTSLPTIVDIHVEPTTKVSELFTTESSDKVADSDNTTDKQIDNLVTDDEKPLEEPGTTQRPSEDPIKMPEFIEPEKSDLTTESPLSPESSESETKAPQVTETKLDASTAPSVTDKQDYTYAPESVPTDSRRTEATSAPGEEEHATKAPETLEPQDKTTEAFKSTDDTLVSKDDYPETTPYLVLLEEHTHKKDIYTTYSDEEVTTSSADLSEKDDEPLTPEDSIDRVTESAPAMETEKPLLGDDESKKDQYVTELVQTTVPEKITEPSLVSEKITTISPAPESHDTEKPQKEESNEISTSAPVKDEKPIETEKPNVEGETEKDGILVTEKPRETAAPEEEFILATTKATTLEVEKGATSPSPIEDKFGKPDEAPKPADSEKPKPDTAEEIPKPGSNDVQPTEEALQPDDESHFPPSGTSGYGQEPDYGEEDSFGPGTCRYGGKVYVSAQQIPRDDPCDFCFCFRSDIICLQQSCPPPIHGCHEEPIQGFCCPRYECPVSMATTLNVTTTTTTTTTTLPPHFLPHAYKGAAQRRGCQIKGHTYKVGEVVRASSGPCLHCTCGGDGQMKCDPKVCTPEPMLRQMIAAAVSAKRRR